ncbi:MAG: 13E12 repeat family protein [Micrococcales bacterium]|nr:13E12 repeat family protein [Micrococcales bacterium]
MVQLTLAQALAADAREAGSHAGQHCATTESASAGVASTAETSPETARDARDVREVLEGVRAEVSGMGARLGELFELVAGLGFAPGVDGDGSMAEDEALEGVVTATQQVLNAAQGVQHATIAQTVRREHRLADLGPARLHGIGHVDPLAVAGIGLALGISANASAARCHQAARLASRHPRLLRGMGAGTVDQTKAARVDTTTREASEAVCGVLDAALADKVPALDPTRVGGVYRRAWERIAPDEAAAARRATRRVDDVEVTPGPDGSTQWWAQIPTLQSAAMWAAVTTLAAQYRKADPALRAGAARAHALADLVLGNATVSAQVTLGIPVIRTPIQSPSVEPGPTALAEADDAAWRGWLAETGLDAWATSLHLDHDDDWEWASAQDWADAATHLPHDATAGQLPGTTLPAPDGTAVPSIEADPWVTSVEIPKVGVIDAETVALVLTRMDVTVGRALLDAATGCLLETRTDAYRVPKAMREFLATRDGTCRWFGCTRPAVADPDTVGPRNADIDHVTPWPAGATTPTGLAHDCRRHHRAKQAPRYRVAISPEGTVTITSPTGTTRTTTPTEVLGWQTDLAIDTALTALDDDQRAALHSARETARDAAAHPHTKAHDGREVAHARPHADAPGQAPRRCVDAEADSEADTRERARRAEAKAAAEAAGRYVDANGHEWLSPPPGHPARDAWRHLVPLRRRPEPIPDGWRSDLLAALAGEPPHTLEDQLPSACHNNPWHWRYDPHHHCWTRIITGLPPF